MPHFTVHTSETALDEKTETGLIRGLTDAVGSVHGEQVSRLVTVDLIGVPDRRRGIGGHPTTCPSRTSP